MTTMSDPSVPQGVLHGFKPLEKKEVRTIPICILCISSLVIAEGDDVRKNGINGDTIA